jgi:hypothetical protein
MWVIQTVKPLTTHGLRERAEPAPVRGSFLPKLEFFLIDATICNIALMQITAALIALNQCFIRAADSIETRCCSADDNASQSCSGNVGGHSGVAVITVGWFAPRTIKVLDRPGGPMAFRFILQPVMATIAAFRDGLKNRRTGRSP